MLLGLSRYAGQEIMIGHDVKLRVMEIECHKKPPMVRLGFDAPRHIVIDRMEIYEVKERRAWLGPPAGVFADGWLCEDESGFYFVFSEPTWSPAFPGAWCCPRWGYDAQNVRPLVGWQFPDDLPFEKRIVKVGPEAEKGKVTKKGVNGA